MNSQAVWAYIHEFSKHLAKEQAARLYHYSPARNALSILRNSELWASSLLFMENNQEAIKGLRLSLRLIDKLLERTAIPQALNPSLQFSYSIHPKKRYALYHYLLLNKLKDRLERYLRAEVHSMVLAFSETQDDLSLWQNYAPKGGYALDFAADHLAIKAANQSFQLLPCYYASWKEQAVLIQGALLGGLQAWFAQVQECYHQNNTMQQAYLDSLKIIDSETQRVHDILLQIISLLKHESFQAEAEWRLISDAVAAEYLHYDEREGSFFPYAPFDFDDSLEAVKLYLPQASNSALTLKGFLASKQSKHTVSVSISRHDFATIPLLSPLSISENYLQDS